MYFCKYYMVNITPPTPIWSLTINRNLLIISPYICRLSVICRYGKVYRSCRPNMFVWQVIWARFSESVTALVGPRHRRGESGDLANVAERRSSFPSTLSLFFLCFSTLTLQCLLGLQMEVITGVDFDFCTFESTSEISNKSTNSRLPLSLSWTN